MSELLSIINDQVNQTKLVVIFALIMARVMAIVVLVPFMGGKNAPPEVKMGIGATLTIILWPTVTANMPEGLPITPGIFIFMMLKETFVGIVIGFIAAEIFYTVEMAGQLIDLYRGANQAQLMVPQITERSSAFGSLGYQLILALFVALNFHHIFIESLFESFVAIPINRFPDLTGGLYPLTEAVMRTGGDIVLVAVLLSMPVAILALIIEVSFGLINRVAPQINAYFMAMPGKVMAGCIVFLAAVSMTIESYIHHSHEMLNRLDKILILFQ
tara:strand:+ start:3795 stop:4610 length:816 start_codon:yes stop_codon:yes gene_type:complete